MVPPPAIATAAATSAVPSTRRDPSETNSNSNSNSNSNNNDDSSSGSSGSGSSGSMVSFSRSDFLANDFSTVEFLASRKHLPIDQFKHDLHSVLRVLKTELVELINNDYAQFISLSTNLIGRVQHIFDAVINQVESGLEHRSLVRVKKAALEVFIDIHNSLEKVQAVIDSSMPKETTDAERIDEKLIERVAIEYNQLQYLVSKGQNLAFVSKITWKIEAIKRTLVSTLSNFVRQAYITLSNDPSNAEAASSLSQSLRVFILIDRVGDALAIFEDTIVRPFVEETIGSSEFLQSATSSDQSTDPIRQLFQKIISFTQLRCLRIYEITTVALKGTPHDLLSEIVWTACTRAIISKAPIIFNAGIPDVFHRNYQTAVWFVTQFERFYKTRESILNLRSQTSYTEFMKKWQLPIYYQIRHNEIIVKFETALTNDGPMDPKAQESNDSKMDLQLKASCALISALLQCWDDRVFLQSLSARFWKLSLQLIRRYADWIAKYVSDDQNRTAPIEEATTILNIYTMNIITRLPSALQSNKLLQDTILSTIDEIEAIGPQLSTRIVSYFANKCSEPLKAGLKSIPGLYRYTNKEPPSKPSYFIPSLFKPLKNFIQDNYTQIGSRLADEWQQAVAKAVTQQFLENVREILAGIKTIEESLKRLTRSKKTQSTTDEGMSDNDKMRLQIHLDVEQYGKELSQLGVTTVSNIEFIELQEATLIQQK
eukprot:jgi/Hompol1/4678/HPOL_000800-RA